MLKRKKRIELFDVVNVGLVVAITIAVLYPLYFCVIASFSKPSEIALGNVVTWIKGFTLDSYKYMLRESQLWVGYRNTIIYTIFGTLYNLVLTIPAAYVMSKRNVPFGKAINWFFFLTMYVGGGLIPQYILVKNLNLINNPLSQIIGVGVGYYNLTITKQYFQTSISQNLYDAAYIDGASEWKAFVNVALPLAKPIITVLTLYCGTSRWNSYFSALMFIQDSKYFPLQLVLRNILVKNQVSIEMGPTAGDDLAYLIQRAQQVVGMKYAIVIIASLPLLLLFPFAQKYFEKGTMVGSVKG
ncbi:MAG: carbohydrate ABC transporter permease [Ruminococcaceae bacterium]|nr:carbohydrate ABC transporter permease [Oscillospiraceae bacterium]